MTVQQKIDKWREGCINSRPGHPEECVPCTLRLILEIEECVKCDACGSTGLNVPGKILQIINRLKIALSDTRPLLEVEDSNHRLIEKGDLEDFLNEFLRITALSPSHLSKAAELNPTSKDSTLQNGEDPFTLASFFKLKRDPHD